MSEADRALGELAGLGRTLANPHLLINPFMRREAALSSRIEGTQASLADLYAYEAGQLPLPGMAQVDAMDVREVANYVYALEYGLKRQQTLPVSLRLLREIHQRLLTGVRGEHSTPGEFRSSQNWIGRPGCTLNEATFVPPPPEAMRAALDALFATPFITIPHAQRVLDVTWVSARRHVERLLAAGIVRQFGEGSYDRLYVAEEILRAIDS